MSPRIGSLGLAVAVAACACTTGAARDGAELTVFAAASLRVVLEDLEAAWSSDHPGVRLTVASDGSNVLAAQITEGAPADVFVSADTLRPRELAEAGLVSGEPLPFARNRVVIVVPRDGDAVGEARDLGEPGVRIVAAGTGVPVTHYADEALAQLAGTMPDTEAFAAAVAANVVSREDNVRAALAKVELGEGDAAIVYRTDLASSDRVREVPWPESVEVSAEYAAVAVSDRPLAAEFVAWLGRPEAGAVLEAASFEVVTR